MGDKLSQDLDEYLWGKARGNEYLKRVAELDASSADALNKKVSGLNESLDKQLRKGIEANLPRLLQQVPILQSLEDTLHVLLSRMNAVAEESSKLSTSCEDNLTQLREQTKLLEQTMHRRNIVADAQRCEELLELLDKRNELVKRSEIICEMKEILSDNKDLLRIAWLKSAMDTKMKIAENEVRRNASEDLKRALTSLNSSLVASSLRALKNLGQIDSELDILLSSTVVQIDKKLIELSSTTESGQNSLPHCVNSIISHLEQAALLDETYRKKFAERLARLIRARVPLDSPFALRFVQQVGRIFHAKQEQFTPALVDSLKPLKNALLTHALARLHHVVDSNDFELSHANAFVDLLNTEIEKEMEKVEWDAELAAKMRTNIEKCIEMVAKKLETHLRLQHADLLLGDRLSASQMTNYRLIQIANGLSKRWPQESRSLVMVENEAVNAILEEMKTSVRAIIGVMNTEKFGAKSVSPYMQELLNYLARVDMHFAHMSRSVCSLEIVSTIADFVVDTFLLNASLIRTYSTDVKQFILLDFSKLLDALRDMEWPLKYGEAAPLLGLFTNEVLHVAANVRGLRRSIVVHLLVSDSPPSLMSPFESVQWTVGDYTKWYEEHDENEVLILLGGLVTSYTSSVVSAGQATFVPNYPTIVEILKSS